MGAVGQASAGWPLRRSAHPDEELAEVLPISIKHPQAAKARLAVIATLSKGYDLDYIWKQVDQSPVRDAAGYYIQASETGGEPPGRWWGPGARALGLEPGQVVERKPYDMLFGERKAPDGTPLGRPPGNGRKAADIGRARRGRS